MFGVNVQLEVFSAYVDTQGLTASDPDALECGIEYGRPVKILRGKHGGRSGRVTFIEQDYVRVIENWTDNEVRAYNNSVYQA